MATKTFKVALSLDNPRLIQSGINVHSFDKQSIKIAIELTKNSQVYQIPTGAQIKISLLKLARQEQKIILDVPFTSADSIDWVVPDYLDGYQGEVRVGVYLIVGAENIDVGYFNITSSVSDIDSAAEEFTESVLQGWAIEDLTALLPQFQAVLDETTGKDVISAPEVILARGGATTLGERLDSDKAEVSAQLAQKASKDIAGFYWVPEKQPDNSPTKKEEIDLQYSTYNQFIALWISLQEKYPNYIKKILLGKDSSNTYDIYKFVLSPTKPKRTIIVSAGIHGDEKSPQYAMYRFTKYLCENWDNPNLSAFKNDIELVILPCVNPWGYQNRKRWNSNGVNLNRNFDYVWSSYTSVSETDQKGSSPFSEIEAQYVRDVLLSYKDTAVAYLDLHSTGAAAVHSRAVLPTNADSFKFIYDNLIPFNTRDIPTPLSAIDINNSIPSSFNYAWHILGLPSSNPEFDDQIWGAMYDADSLTKALEWNGNLVLQHAKLEKPSGFQVFEQTYTNTGHNVIISNTGALGGGTYVENPLLQFEVPVNFDGIAIVNYSLVIRGDAAGMTTFLAPRIFQYHGIDKDETSGIGELADRYENYFDGNTRTALSLVATMPIVKGGNLHVGLAHYVTAGTSQIWRYRAVVQLIPSNNKPRAASYRRNNPTDTLVRYNV